MILCNIMVYHDLCLPETGAGRFSPLSGFQPLSVSYVASQSVPALSKKAVRYVFRSRLEHNCFRVSVPRDALGQRLARRVPFADKRFPALKQGNSSRAASNSYSILFFVIKKLLLLHNKFTGPVKSHSIYMQ